MTIKTKRMICLLVGIVSVLTIIGTVSYAYFTAISEINNQTATLSTGTARVTFRDGDTGMTGASGDPYILGRCIKLGKEKHQQTTLR